MDLVHAESEGEVTEILEKQSLLDNEKNWKNYGDVPTNFNTVSNQQSDPIAALVEKIVNSIDAVLMRESLKRGQDLRSEEAPSGMFEASEDFFGVPEGNIAKMYEQKEKRNLAKNIYFVATGERSSPSFSVIDKGEGQHPDDLPETILSLHQANKNEIPFVQGRFNMGGTGVLPFCGKKGYQLVVSKRFPDINRRDNNPWGFTVVRKRSPKKLEKNPTYEYLVHDGKIPRFESHSLPLLPENSQPYIKDIDWGTLIKLFEYDTPIRTDIKRDLYRRFNQRLFYLPLPVIMHETRYEADTKYVILEGMRARLESRKFRDEVLEKPDFPIDFGIKVSDGSYAKVKVWLLKPEIDSQKWIRASEAISYTVNGQTHSSESRRFFGRKSVKKDYIKNDLLVEVNCTDFDTELLSSMFMGSRDRMRDMEETKDLEKALEKELKNDSILKEYNQRRREENIDKRFEKSEETEKIFKEFVERNPEISKLLGGNGSLPDPFKMGPRKEPFEGERFPHYLDLITPKSKEMVVPINSYRRIVFETDVENEFFTRLHEPGNLAINPMNWVKGDKLRNGKLTITVEPPDDVEVGSCQVLDITVDTPNKLSPFETSIFVEVGPKQTRKRNPKGQQHDTSLNVDIPPIHEIYKDQWDKSGMDWDEESVAEVRFSDEGTDIFVNMDNINLQRTLRRREYRKKERPIKHLYKIGIGTMAFTLKQQIDEIQEETWHQTLKAISMAWLPSIMNLHELVDL